MAQIPNKIIGIIKQFVQEAAKDNINITQAILFGSYAKGTNHEYSDIDIAVVSEDFEGTRFYDNRKIVKALLRTSIDLETHPYRPEEFTPEDIFVKEILSYGIRIV
jgi:uncharacterized protein